MIRPVVGNERARRVILVLLWVAAVVLLVLEGYFSIGSWYRDPHVELTAQKFAAGDVDDAVFLRDIHAHRSLAGPLFWWHSGWHGTAYPWYWRPLTMFSFWTEYHLFGAYRFDRWQTADVLFHFLFAAVVAWFGYRLTRSRFVPPLTLIVLTGFDALSIPIVSNFVNSFTTPSTSVVLTNWKDQPEEWTGIFTLLSLMFAMRRRWMPSLAMAAVSVCFKESGWLTFPMLLATLLYTGDLRKLPLYAWLSTIATCIVLIALRATAGRNVMFPHSDTHLSNGFSRYLIHVIDPRVLQYTTDTWPIGLLAAFLVFLAIKVRLRPILMLPAVIGGFAVSAVLLSFAKRTDTVTAFALLVDPSTGPPLLVATFVDYFIVVTAWAYRPFRRTMVFLFSLVLLSDLPEMAILQPNNHMVYFTHGLQSLLVTIVGVSFVREIVLRVRARRRTSTPSPIAVGPDLISSERPNR